MTSTTRLMQGAFTGGELAPSLYARVDLAKYAAGLKTAKNVFVHAHGGVSNRPGFQYLGTAHVSSSPVRLIPFEFNDTGQVYILEFGHLYMRVWKDGGLVLSGGSPFVLVTPFDSIHVGKLSFAQEYDTLYLAHPSYAPRKIVRLAEDNWTIATVDFTVDAKAPTGLVVSPAYGLPKTSSPASITVKVVAVDSLGRRSAVSSGVTPGPFHYTEPEGTFIRVTWNAVANAVKYIVYRTDASVGWMGETTGLKFETTSIGTDTSNPPPGAADPGATAGTPGGVAANVIFGKTIRYKVSAVMEDTGEESLPTAQVAVQNDLSYKDNRNTLSWTAPSLPAGKTVAYYVIYKELNGLYGYIGRSDSLSFVDDNLDPDISQTPQRNANPFNAAGKYPRAVQFHEGRLWWGGTNQNPMGVWGSQSGNYESQAGAEVPKASDAIVFRTRGQQINQVRSMVSAKALLVFTSGGVYSVTGGDESFLSPSNILAKEQTNRGASDVAPIKIGETVLYCTKGGIVRDIKYEFSEDNYIGNDLTIMARHLWDGYEVKAWAWAESPYSILWVIRSDGRLLALTYLREHEVWAWSKMATGTDFGQDGIFESIASVTEGGQDRVYVVVRRTVNGVNYRYIERLNTRIVSGPEGGIFLDSALTYSGAAATVISGLEHLAGKTVNVLADGNVIRDKVVAGGVIVLPAAAELVHVGLPYTAELETLELDVGQVRGLGYVQGRQKSIAKVTLRVEKTRGIFIGHDTSHLIEHKARSTEAWGEPTSLTTGDIDVILDPHWSRNGSFVVRQTDPLPMTILAAFPDVALGG